MGMDSTVEVYASTTSRKRSHERNSIQSRNVRFFWAFFSWIVHSVSPPQWFSPFGSTLQHRVWRVHYFLHTVFHATIVPGSALCTQIDFYLFTAESNMRHLHQLIKGPVCYCLKGIFAVKSVFSCQTSPLNPFPQAS